MEQDKELETSQRLTNQDYRDFYQRPFYRWDCDETTKKKHKQEYEFRLEQYLENPPSDDTIYNGNEEQDRLKRHDAHIYVIHILEELIKDLS